MIYDISLDTETWYDKECSVKPLGPWAYSRHPQFYCYLISVFDGHEKWVGEPQDFNWAALEGQNVWSHNALFDHTVVESMQERGEIPQFRTKTWECTANMTAALCNRRSLKDAMMFLYGEERSKDARGDMKGIHWKDVKNTPQGVEFLAYAGTDAVDCWRIQNDFKGHWSPFERYLSNLTIRQCMHGVQIDTHKLDCYLEMSKVVLFNIEKRMPWVGQGEKPTGTKAIATACRAAGIPCPPVKAHEGEEAHEAWMKHFGPKYPWVSAVSQWRSLNKFIGILEKMKQRLRPDGVMPFSLKYFGAHTGRWSGDSGINLQNMKRDPILIDREGHLRMDDASMNEYNLFADRNEQPDWLGTTNWGLTEDVQVEPPDEYQHIYDIRSLILPRPGKKLVLCDLSQIEPRVLAWLSGHEKLLEAIRNGYGVYEAAAVARGLYSGPKGEFQKVKSLYQMQKAQTLALGFGCGWEKYIDAAMTMAGYDVCANDPINPETGRRIWGYTARKEVKSFREENKPIPDYWSWLEASFQSCVGGNFVLTLPSGRVMTYRDVREGRKKKRIEIKNDDGDVIETRIEERRVFTAEIDGRRYELYGGLLAENATQATAREVFASHLPAVESTGADILFTAHDESISEVPLDFDPALIKAAHSVTPEWLPGCPIGAKAIEALCYLK